MSRSTLVRALGAITLLAGSFVLSAQTATISGTVTDPSGGAISGAKINAIDSKTSTEKSTIADAAGQYSLTTLAPGTYTVKVEFPGFSSFEKKDVSVANGASITLPIIITPAASSTTVDVNARIDQFEVVPSTPTGSVFGLETPLYETPRSISVVPAEMMARYDIKTVNDLVAATPGSFTGSYFGVPGALFIRGEAGDNFYRGFRRVENRGNYQTPVGDAEELEVVKGPPSPVYGGGKVGGFLNYTPKSARSTTAKWLEHPTGKLTLTYGSYDQKQGTIEFGSPFKMGQRRGGFYSFFSVEDSKSYYKGNAEAGLGRYHRHHMGRKRSGRLYYQREVALVHDMERFGVLFAQELLSESGGE